MSFQWFRMYHEFAGDPVIQSLDFGDQRHFVMILCLKSSGFLDKRFSDPTLKNKIVSKALGLDHVAGCEARRRLQEVGLIDSDWQPVNWAKRQYQSDNSTERVRKWRGKSSPTPPPEEQNSDTDTDTERKRYRNVSETFHVTLPLDAWQEWIEHRKARRWPCDPTTLKKQLSLLAKYDSATQREIIDNSIQAGWQGLFAPKGSNKPRPTRYDELMGRLESGPNPLLTEGKL